MLKKDPGKLAAAATNSTAKNTVWNRDFICAALANMMLCLGHFASHPFIASYAEYLGAGMSLAGFLTGMFYGVALAMRPISGPMITRLDKRKLMMGVFGLGAVANLGYALFPSVPLFIAFRFINGAQYSFVGSLILTRIGDSLPNEKMASGMGIYGISGSIGMSIAPAVGGWMRTLGETYFGGNELAGYRMLFLYSMSIMLLAMIPCALSSPDAPRKDSPVLSDKWYKNIFDSGALGVASIMLFLIMAYSVYSAFIVEFAEERSIVGASAFFTVQAVALIIFRPVMGAVSDKYGTRVALPSMALFAASFIIAGAARGLPMLLVGAVVSAAGYGAAQPMVQAMSMRVVPRERRGVASNTLYIGMDLGFFLGPLFGGFTAERAGGYGTMFYFAVIPAVLAAVAFIAALPGYKRLAAKYKD
ncbi:MAG: MFS transporter [Oscillospiraceae bacterium]|jgi:MFS family permease|nr:MFS transporter [Oscillospiraceae bacterium]